MLSRIFINSNDRLNSATTRPSDFFVSIPPLDTSYIYALRLASLVIENLPAHPSFKPSNASFAFTYNGTDYNFTLNTAVAYTSTSIITELNSYYQALTSQVDSPFSFDLTTGKLSIVANNTFSIDPTAENSGWKKLGYQDGDATEAVLSGGNYILIMGSNMNLSRTSYAYLRVSMMDSSTGSSISLQDSIIAMVPISTKFGDVIVFEPTNSRAIVNDNETISQIRISILDNEYNELVLNKNAHVSIEFEIDDKIISNDGDSIDDRREYDSNPVGKMRPYLY